MGKIEDFQIIPSKLEFLAGESVTGTVHFRVTNKTKVDTLVVNLEGKGEVKWYAFLLKSKYSFRKKQLKNHLNNQRVIYIGKKQIIYDDYAEYLNKSVQLISKVPDSDLFIYPGDCIYEFTFQLPDRLPSRWFLKFCLLYEIIK
jgi:hypothetical protein